MVTIRPLERNDLAEADRIFRLAFGTFTGLADPMSFMGDAELIRTRWEADPASGLGAFDDGRLVGSNLIVDWGSFGFFGPLTVRPDLWGKGIAKQLLEATLPLFEQRGIRHTGLFTFPHSVKHHALYQKFGYWPQYLTVLAAKGVEPGAGAAQYVEYSKADEAERGKLRAECAAVAAAIFPGLSLEAEIRSVAEQRLGETVMIREGGVVCGFGVCHAGKGSEAGTGNAYVKFGGVVPGVGAGQRFGRLIESCEAWAAARGIGRIMAGVNTARHDAYRILLGLGYRAMYTGVAMQRPNEPGFNRPDCYVLDDWR